MLKSFKNLNRFERNLWFFSVMIVSLSYILLPEKDYIHLFTSLIGVTSLIFISKGNVFGHILGIIFSLFYGMIAFYFHYYGEMITYFGINIPMALLNIYSWIKHPYDNYEVEVKKINRNEFMILSLITILITFIFYFILKAFNTTQLFFSTISIATSFLASSLSFFRSPYYALAYACNDIVLMILWALATMEDMSYFPIIICFLMFLLNDFYGYYNWQRMMKRQKEK